MVAGMVCCRSGASRAAPTVDPRRSLRRVRSRAGGRVRRWPVAISIASGRPSTARQMATTSSRLRSRLKLGSIRRASCSKSATASELARRVGVVADRQRVHVHHELAGDPQQRPAGRQHLDAGRPLQDPADDRGGVDDVLEVVQDDQQRASVQRLLERLLGGVAGGDLHPEPAGHDLGDQARLAGLRQVHEADLAGGGVGVPVRHLLCQPGLADPAGPDEGDHLAQLESLQHLGDLLLAARSCPWPATAPASPDPHRPAGRSASYVGIASTSARRRRGRLARVVVELAPPDLLHEVELPQRGSRGHRRRRGPRPAGGERPRRAGRRRAPRPSGRRP